MATSSGKGAKAKRARGRPPRLSREAILEAGLALLERSPEEPLTLSRVAQEVDAVPAALYRHVGSHDELLDGVLGLVLEGIRFEIRRRASWRSQVRDWMTSVRAHLLRYPAVVPLIGRRGRTSPAWFDATNVLIEILEKAGARGRRLARAYLWVAETTMGCIVNEASIPYSEQIEGARNALPEMSEDARKRQASLFTHLAAMDGDAFFEFMTDRTIAALPEFTGGRAVRKPRR
jgi:AcrR family transcriptional regulator